MALRVLVGLGKSRPNLTPVCLVVLGLPVSSFNAAKEESVLTLMALDGISQQQTLRGFLRAWGGTENKH